MGRVTCQLSVSLDGFVAGPDQSLEHPLGIGGDQLHRWAFGPPEPHPVDAEVAAHVLDGNGAYVLGRRMFGGGSSDGSGGWDPAWRGWWGDDPPYHAPVFVLTHHPREPLPMAGGTTFHFITGGIHEALDRARDVAGEADVAVGGGAATARQFLAAGLIDQLDLHLVPVLLGTGERLFDGLDALPRAPRPVDVVASPAVTHISYRFDA